MNENRKRIVIETLIRMLKSHTGNYGYDIWLGPHVEHSPLWTCAIEILKLEPPPYVPPTGGGYGHQRFMSGEDGPEAKLAKELYPLACDVLWLFCLRGILRPGVRLIGGQAVGQGDGYSLTLKGREWVKAPSEADIKDLIAAL